MEVENTPKKPIAISERYAWILRSQSEEAVTLDANAFFEGRRHRLLGASAQRPDQSLLKLLPDPFLFKDIKKSVDRICAAMENSERITIFGDYDVDGTTSCAMLRLFFEEIGYPVEIYIPERLVEGYGLNPVGLQKIRDSGGGLVITVDNGISAVKACERAKELGLDVIITDHHDIPPVLPDAFAIINPKQSGCNYPYKMLAGVGVAFYLMAALRQQLRQTREIEVNLRSYLDFVAIGTIADVAPLDGVNHVLCRVGLQVLTDHVRAGKRPGLAALLLLSGYTGEDVVGSSDIGFKIGPRLNAAGRLGTALAAEEIMSTSDQERARELAEWLHGENAERQAIEKQIKEQAFEQVLRYGEIPPAIALHHPDWHTGVVGIVASRVLEKYYRPTIICGSLDGKIKGSGRSTHAFDLFGALNKVREGFVSFGGHFHAVGVTLAPEKWDWFCDHLVSEARQNLNGYDVYRPLSIDAVVEVKTLSDHFVSGLSSFEPFGPENPRPRWLLRGCFIRALKPIGRKESNHVQICLCDASRSEIWVTGFDFAEACQRVYQTARQLSVVVEARIEVWKGIRRTKFTLVDFLVESV